MHICYHIAGSVMDQYTVDCWTGWFSIPSYNTRTTVFLQYIIFWLFLYSDARKSEGKIWKRLNVRRCEICCRSSAEEWVWAELTLIYCAVVQLWIFVWSEEWGITRKSFWYSSSATFQIIKSTFRTAITISAVTSNKKYVAWCKWDCNFYRPRLK